MSFTDILLWLFVMNLGIALGAGIYEARIVVPLWTSSSSDSGSRWNAEAARRIDSGRQFWAFVTTVPLTLLTLASLVAAWQAQGARGDWWLAAAVAIFVERIATFAYFIPTIIRLQNNENLSNSTVRAIVSRWVSLNYVRHAIYLVAWLAALIAFSLPREPGV